MLKRREKRVYIYMLYTHVHLSPSSITNFEPSKGEGCEGNRWSGATLAMRQISGLSTAAQGRQMSNPPSVVVRNS